ncbi:hypothetical protein EXIGLDRAFT_287294 [Exidia glandulosa HHB12029]|uniref:DUF6570 domain-containing protein n=1 Tax=Exidia glandulosa HHB12029 TaxID=1314781 RepID=A0A166B880_EXIGL|nr:hypothetical protein EXIGLDRAFT_287294 [Exidia glandulosa HHB12029]
MPDEAKWPQILNEDQKCDILKAFKHATGKSALQQFVCASCHARYPESEKREVLLDPDLLDLFHVHDHPESLATHTTQASVPTFLYSASVLSDAAAGLTILSCRDCRQALARGKLPPLAVANDLVLGSIPQELQDLTMVEEAMIARCRAKAWIVQLKQDQEEEGLPGAHRPWAQQAMRGCQERFGP